MYEVFVLLFLALFVYLLATEVLSQDCKDRTCYNTTPPVTSADTPKKAVDKLIHTLKTNHSSVEWRKALMLGLIVAALISHNTLRCYVVVVLIVFVFVYFSSDWMNWVKWCSLDETLEKQLLLLRKGL